MLASRLSRNQDENNIKLLQKDYRLLDSAWDKFSEYIGEHDLKTPVTIAQFEEIIKEIDIENKFLQIKEHILYSLQYECYAWPLVERENSKKK